MVRIDSEHCCIFLLRVKDSDLFAGADQYIFDFHQPRSMCRSSQKGHARNLLSLLPFSTFDMLRLSASEHGDSFS